MNTTQPTRPVHRTTVRLLSRVFPTTAVAAQPVSRRGNGITVTYIASLEAAHLRSL